MQDTLLRVFVVAFGLLTHPINDPGVEEELDEVDMQNNEKRLLRAEENLDQEMAPIIEEMTRFDSLRPWKSAAPEDQLESDQSVNEKEKISVIKNGTKQDLAEDSAHDKMPEHSIANSDPNWAQISKSKLEHSFRNSNKPQGKREKHEKEEKVHTRTSENETSEDLGDWKNDYLCYLWNTFSIISMICFLRNYMRKNSIMNHHKAKTSLMSCIAGEVSLPDSDTLHIFHSKCVQGASKNKWRGDEFLEGFSNDLLEAMKAISNTNGGMVIGNFWMDAYDINVSIIPPEPYSFQCLLWNNHASDLLPDMQVCGHVKVVEKQIQNGCHCQSSDAEDDMVCLLHCDNEKVQTKVLNVFDVFCIKNSPYLSKSRVTRWFQSTIKQAWALISHKYEFELSIRYIDAPGALVIRFRSGKEVNFRMNPVVKFNTNAHFYITPYSPRNLDNFWTISLTAYEDSVLQCLSKRLPEKSCHIQTLEIACFLHRRQTALSGSSIVKDFHFKTALMHLLLTKDASQWKPNHLSNRVQDLMDFMERSLEKKLLHHVLIGNSLIQGILQLPVEFTQAKPVNLFHPLVAHNCIYSNAMMNFQELLRNAPMLIQDYTEQCFDY
ncbi:Inositol 1,4,5-trisphosphate receptor-interacting protein Precursor [Channa argus]|uniref:Inositol 1,4,5-trisphosphate receptor-interacting protein n=1 Tax=Channa argus TaxID=215402 RepID=A0A6G1PAG6_CHAAH|nr:Inositol 1,4,5-trisphosphate receptor-interacting protein Precursor [Channa argus]